MDGIIFDIKKFALHDGPGIRTTLFFKGCPLNCLWCHNPESRLSEPESVNVGHGEQCKKSKMIGRKISSDLLFQEILKDEMFYVESGGGVTFSGGEPMLQSEFLLEILLKCKQNNLHTTVDTCGHVSWDQFESVLNYVDLFLYDIKLIDEDMHRQYISVSNELIKENLLKLVKAGAKVRVRIPLIAGITDTDDNISATVQFLKQLPELLAIDLLPYNKFGEDKIERYNLPRKRLGLHLQDEATLNSIKHKFTSEGMEVQIGG